MWIHGLLSRPPASSSSTRHRPASLSRPATAQPADPAPVTIKSKVSFAFVVILYSPNCAENDSEAGRHLEGRAAGVSRLSWPLLPIAGSDGKYHEALRKIGCTT